MKIKKIISMFLCTMLIVSLGTGYCMAATNSAQATSSATYYSFYLDLPKGGVTDLATARSKASSATYAYYDLSTVTNNTNHELYLNVRNSGGTSIVGTARAIPAYVKGTNLEHIAYVYYKSGYGNVGTKYRPSGQTSNEATKSAYIEGTWRP